MKTKICSDWEVNADGTESCMHFTDGTDLAPQDDKDMITRHILLEFLDMLKVVEYTRGYDGYYYDLTIKL